MRHNIWLIALSAIAGLALGAGLGVLIYKQAVPTDPPADSLSSHSAAAAADNVQLYEAALAVARAVYNSDYAVLGAWAHPERGCLFAPFSTVDRQKDLVFTPAQLQAMDKDKTEYAWGVADQNGQPLTMTPSEFFRDYLQIRDFSAAPGVGFDTVLRVGNAVENIQGEYPDCRVVDLYYPGTGKDPAGADWASLKLAFTGDGANLKLVAIVRSVYTEQ